MNHCASVFCVQHQLECALLGLGQFQNTLDELHTWLSRTAEQLQGLQPISIDLQTCEIELAKHKVSVTKNELVVMNVCSISTCAARFVAWLVGGGGVVE